MKAMVLAAGVGSRLDPLTSQLPKPLVPVANRPVMEHILNLLKKNGVEDVVSNLHYLPDKIRSYFGDGNKFGLNIDFRYEPELSGDAGGVRACKQFFAQDTFIVLMGDLLTDADLSAVIAEHKAKKALATIAVKKVDDVSQFGVVLTDKNGFIIGFQEKPQTQEALSDMASTGIYIFEPAIFDYMPKEGNLGFGKQLFPSLLDKEIPLLAVEISSYWSDVGTIKQYRNSNFDVLDGNLKVNIAGETFPFGYMANSAHLDSNVNIEGTILLGKNSKIERGVRIKGRVIVGDNCRIERNAILEDTIVWSSSIVEENASLNNCIVGSDCIVQNGTKHKQITAVNWAQPAIKI